MTALAILFPAPFFFLDHAVVVAAVSIVECAAYGGFMRAAWERMKK